MPPQPSRGWYVYLGNSHRIKDSFTTLRIQGSKVDTVFIDTSSLGLWTGPYSTSTLACTVTPDYRDPGSRLVSDTVWITCQWLDSELHLQTNPWQYCWRYLTICTNLKLFWQYDNMTILWTVAYIKIVYWYNNTVDNIVDEFVHCIVILSYCLIVTIVSNLYILSGIGTVLLTILLYQLE